MRTEDDLRAALTALERHAPSRERVMPAPRKDRRKRWMTVALVTGATAAAIALTVAEEPANPHATLRTAILTAFSSVRGDIVYTRSWADYDGSKPPPQQAWMSPWQVQPGQTVHERMLATDAEGKPYDDVEQTYTQPATGTPKRSATIDVDYGARTWYTGEEKTIPNALQGMASLREEVANGALKVVGHPVIKGQRTIELRVTGTLEKQRFELTMWVNADTYRPAQAEVVNGKNRVRTTFQFLPPTLASQKLLQPPIPAGFRQVTPPPYGVLP